MSKKLLMWLILDQGNIDCTGAETVAKEEPKLAKLLREQKTMPVQCY